MLGSRRRGRKLSWEDGEAPRQKDRWIGLLLYVLLFVISIVAVGGVGGLWYEM